MLLMVFSLNICAHAVLGYVDVQAPGAAAISHWCTGCWVMTHVASLGWELVTWGCYDAWLAVHEIA